MSDISDAQIREVFDTFDADRNGSIDKNEIKKVCEALGLDANESDISDLIKQADADGNGKIEFEEFKNAVLK